MTDYYGVDVSGKKFTVHKEYLEKIPYLNELFKNNHKDNFYDGNLFVQCDPEIFQILLNYVSLPNYKIPKNHFNDFICVAKMMLLCEPIVNNHITGIIKYESEDDKVNYDIAIPNIYDLNSFYTSFKVKKYKNNDNPMTNPFRIQFYVNDTRILESKNVLIWERHINGYKISDKFVNIINSFLSDNAELVISVPYYSKNLGFNFEINYNMKEPNKKIV